MNGMLPRLLAGVVTLTIVMLAALAGMGFLMAALYTWLTGVLPAWGAALAVAGVCFVVVAAALIAMRIAVSMPPPVAASADTSAPPTGGDAFGDLAYDLGRIGAEKVRENPYATLAAAIVAGVVVGASPTARRQLFNLMDRVMQQ